METAIVGALGYWGYCFGSSQSMKIIWCILVPLVGFGFWGAVDFHEVGKFSELLRLIQELLVSGLAAWALYSTGLHISGISLGILSLLHHAFVYMLGERLLKD